jgi:pyridoxine kinase
VILPTAILSTHTGGFTGFTFRDLTEDIDPICAHWKELGIETDALYTGYLGSQDQQQQIARIFDEFSANDPLIMVDPAMADAGKLYPAFDLEFARGMTSLVAKASLTVPNITEACLLLQKDYPGEDYDQAWIEQTMKELSDLGPAQVVLTGVSFEEGKLGAAAYDRTLNAFSYYFTERIEGYFHGTGDIYSSTLLAALLNGKSLVEAIGIACEFTVGAIRRTVAAQTEPRYGVDFENEIACLLKSLGKN